MKYNQEEGGDILYEKFANLLEKTHKTAYQVSKDTGIGENIFSYWKSGRSNPKFDKLLILAKYFDVPVEYFEKEETVGQEKEKEEAWTI